MYTKQNLIILSSCWVFLDWSKCSGKKKNDWVGLSFFNFPPICFYVLVVKDVGVEGDAFYVKNNDGKNFDFVWFCLFINFIVDNLY